MKRLLLIITGWLIFSCQTSRIIHTWKAENTSPARFNKVLVLGVLTEDDRELKSVMENHLADDLKEMGQMAYAANTIYEPGTFIKGDTMRAMQAIQEKGFDAVLTVVLLNKTKEKYYVPGRSLHTPFAYNYNRFDRYYFTIYDRIYSDGYYAEETRLFWESNFYSVGEKRMLYSAQTRSFEPGSKETLAHYFGVLIANNLVKQKIILPPNYPD